METPSDRVLWVCVSWGDGIFTDDTFVHLHTTEEAARACPENDGYEALKVVD